MCVCPAVWGYSILSVTLVSACALTSVFVVPLMRTRFMRRVLIYFIALSIGTLLSTAILQLLPEVQYPSTHFHPNTPNQPQIKINLRGVSGIVAFFLLSSFTQCFLLFIHNKTPLTTVKTPLNLVVSSSFPVAFISSMNVLLVHFFFRNIKAVKNFCSMSVLLV